MDWYLISPVNPMMLADQIENQIENCRASEAPAQKDVTSERLLLSRESTSKDMHSRGIVYLAGMRDIIQKRIKKQ